jgi:NADH-quinone oxidoreductase subunit K
MITLQHYLVLSVIVFCIGAIGVLLRRNLLVTLMSIQVMLVAACIALMAFARWNLLSEGKAILAMLFSVITAQVIVAVTLVVAIFKVKGSVNREDMNLLSG